MKVRTKLILGVVLFGSIWGGLEATVISSMEGTGTLIPRSVVLALVSLAVLSYARFALPRKGSTLLIGLVAVGFKLLGLPMLFGCQAAAVVGQAIVLEAAFTMAQNRGWLTSLPAMMLVVPVAGVANALLFSFSQAYVFANPWWLDRGAVGCLSWSFSSGVLAAAAGAIGFLAARMLVKLSLASYVRFVESHSRAYVPAAITVSACCWIAGALL
ncbi:MAG TPA: hypothetical protein VMY05_01980 [Acidobacteriota bacterium]|nr:hypothetical protein [Acidobacteriota bacterium]